MRSIVFSLVALAAPLVSAHPPRAASMTEVELYTPSITTINPFSAQEDDPDSSEITLRCETFGPQCMTFPRDSSKNETIGVRVYCAAAILKPRKPSRHPVPTIHARQRHPHLKYALVPAMMNPCPAGALCNVTIDESKRPPPPSRSGAAIPSDAWLWFENEEGIVPALGGEDMSAWAKPNWLDQLASVDSEEADEPDDDDKNEDKDDDDDDGDKGDDKNDDEDKEGGYDGLAGFDIDIGSAGPERLNISRPRIPPIPKIPWFKFTCFVEDDTEPPVPKKP
ncbi:hypothetical protein F5B18DRAFT_657073 [Nemania serpens]|nr:hypothetical protein F5B18DRAFT_657073 [Nemania serpens]